MQSMPEARNMVCLAHELLDREHEPVKGCDDVKGERYCDREDPDKVLSTKSREGRRVLGLTCTARPLVGRASGLSEV
jgi:hypothetical protein